MCSKALAKQNNCLCPIDKLEPPVSIMQSKPPSLLTVDIRSTLVNADHISASLNSPRGSIFSLILPEYKNGSCGIQDSLDLKLMLTKKKTIKIINRNTSKQI